MAENSVTEPLSTDCDGVQTDFPVSFDYGGDPARVFVALVSDAGVETPQSRPGDYTLVDTGGGAMAARFVTAPPDGYRCVRWRVTPPTQPSTLVALVKFPAGAVEAALDHLARGLQDAWAPLKRAPRAQFGEEGPLLPKLATLEGRALVGAPGGRMVAAGMPQAEIEHAAAAVQAAGNLDAAGAVSALRDGVAAERDTLAKIARAITIVTPEDFNALGDGASDDKAALQAAIAALKARGGGVLRGQRHRKYAIASGLLIDSPDITLDLTLAPTGAANFNCVLVSGAGHGGATTVAANIARGDRTIQVANAAAAQVGRWAHIHARNGSLTTGWSMSGRITAVAGDLITLDRPVMFAVNTAWATKDVSFFTPAERVTVERLAIDPAQWTATDGVGLKMVYGVDCRAAAIEGLAGGPGNGELILSFITADCDFGEMRARGWGRWDGASSYLHDMYFARDTGSLFGSMWSRDSEGFGPYHQYCQASVIGDVWAYDARARGYKLQSSTDCSVRRALADGAGFTGVSLNLGTQNCTLGHVTATNCGGEGFWIDDEAENRDNTITHVDAFGNTGYDIYFYPNSTRNTVLRANFTNRAKVLLSNTTNGIRNANGESAVFAQDDSNGVARSYLDRWSNSPAASDNLVWHSWRGADSAAALVRYVEQGARITSPTNGAHEGMLLTFTARGGVLTQEMYAAGGIVVGAPSGNAKGVGTVNATAVYDDNSLLTCYVLEYWRTGAIDLEKWDALVPDTIIPAQDEVRDADGGLIAEAREAQHIVRRHAPARGFAQVAEDRLDPEKFFAFLRDEGRLPAFPAPDRFVSDFDMKMGVGDTHQRLWETAEVLAVLLAKAFDRIKALEEAA